MSDNKKYYYLKLKESFFDDDEIKILEDMDNGYKYSNLLLKLYLKSLKYNGKLRLNEYIPYDTKMISSITHTDVDTVRVALKVFEKLKLIEILEDGTVYMLQIQNFIGKSSTEADRVRNYRNEIEEEKNKLITDGVQMYDECTPELELEKELDIEKEIEIETETDIEKEIKQEDEEVPKVAKVNWSNILTVWNDLPSPIKPIRSITSIRKDKVRARIRSLKLTEEDIIAAINNIKLSDFLQGKNPRGWIIEFDWLFKDDTRFSKVLEGNYNNKNASNKNYNKNVQAGIDLIKQYENEQSEGSGKPPWDLNV